MADNVELDPGTGGAIIATDDAGAGGHVQIVKLAYSADGVATVIGADVNGLDVDVTRSALPSGASTSAKQDTVIGHLDGVETVLGTIDADTSAIAAAVSGTEVQVDVVGALPAGTNNIGDVDVLSLPALAAGTNNIGDVDVLTVPADPFGANADAAATAGSTGSIQAKLRLMTSQLDSIKTAVETLDNAIAGSELQVDVVGALPAGTAAIGKLAANSGVDIGDVDVTSISAGTNAIGNVGLIGRTTGGLSIFRTLDADETEEEIKATAGQLFGWYIFNDGAADVSVKFYNATAANVTVGTTTPVMTLTIPAASGANAFSDIGIAFSTAITVAAVTEIADNGTTAPAANQVIVNAFYV